jgi:hypothetical protein
VSTVLILNNLATGPQSGLTVRTQISNNDVLTVSDNQSIIHYNSSNNINVNTSSNLSIGFICTLIQANTGTITIRAGNNTTVKSYANSYTSMGQNAVITVFCPVANTFYLTGSLI